MEKLVFFQLKGHTHGPKLNDFEVIQYARRRGCPGANDAKKQDCAPTSPKKMHERYHRRIPTYIVACRTVNMRRR
ncbi:MAG: hypothetical protein GY778_17670 [bacterium]|nr:hypothetical protein [bacterium]